jgi:hypothetical protein
MAQVDQPQLQAIVRMCKSRYGWGKIDANSESQNHDPFRSVTLSLEGRLPL